MLDVKTCDYDRWSLTLNLALVKGATVYAESTISPAHPTRLNPNANRLAMAL